MHCSVRKPYDCLMFSVASADIAELAVFAHAESWRLFTVFSITNLGAVAYTCCLSWLLIRKWNTF